MIFLALKNNNNNNNKNLTYFQGSEKDQCGRSLSPEVWNYVRKKAKVLDAVIQCHAETVTINFVFCGVYSFKIFPHTSVLHFYYVCI